MVVVKYQSDQSIPVTQEKQFLSFGYIEILCVFRMGKVKQFKFNVKK